MGGSYTLERARCGEVPRSWTSRVAQWGLTWGAKTSFSGSGQESTCRWFTHKAEDGFSFLSEEKRGDGGADMFLKEQVGVCHFVFSIFGDGDAMFLPSRGKSATLSVALHMTWTQLIHAAHKISVMSENVETVSGKSEYIPWFNSFLNHLLQQ